MLACADTMSTAGNVMVGLCIISFVAFAAFVCWLGFRD